ncbi:hypothetical protein [Sphaerisporangium aureirubrum]|uniref:Uncharacterized protein n=1 Tax=Sphaerisporangium aureirubrum TaxID=1544736 RepID=A0ABW1NLP5_9ACTN
MAAERVDVVEQGPGGSRWVRMVVLAVLVVVPIIGILVNRSEDRPSPISTPAPVRNVVGITPNAVYPEADGTGDTRTLRVTFPDGGPTPEGFLTLSAGGPVRLARPGEVRDGVLVGPQLWLGGLSRRMLVLAPVPGCAREVSVVLDARHAISGSTCRDGFHLAVSGDEGFVRSVIEDVRVRPL